MDIPLDLEARRLFVSTALTAHAVRCLKGRIAEDSNAAELLVLARRLGEETILVQRRYRFRIDPPYPGLTAGPETVRGGLRIVLACKVSNDGTPLGVVFTTLIPGRLPQVSVAPVEASITEEWRPVADT